VNRFTMVSCRPLSRQHPAPFASLWDRPRGGGQYRSRWISTPRALLLNERLAVGAFDAGA
jgi:hypothetical protein